MSYSWESALKVDEEWEKFLSIRVDVVNHGVKFEKSHCCWSPFTSPHIVVLADKIVRFQEPWEFFPEFYILRIKGKLVGIQEAKWGLFQVWGWALLWQCSNHLDRFLEERFYLGVLTYRLLRWGGFLEEILREFDHGLERIFSKPWWLRNKFLPGWLGGCSLEGRRVVGLSEKSIGIYSWASLVGVKCGS